MNTLLENALGIAAGGLPVFPCALNGTEKSPVCAGGHKAATKEPGRIRSLFSHSAANIIGMPTGEVSGVIVVDIDPRHDGNTWYDAHRAQLPATRTHRTLQGGLHVLFRDGGHGIRNSAARIAQGVDVRGNGGWVVWPPSPGYSVLDDAPIADMPAWLVDLCRKPADDTAHQGTASAPARPWTTTPRATDASPYGAAALASAADEIRNAVEGQKHDTINRVGYSIGGLVAAGELLEGEAFQALSEALSEIRSACKNFRAAQATLARSFQEGKRRPREVPERQPEVEPDLSNIAPFIAKYADLNAAIQRAAADAAMAQQAKQAEIPAGVFEVDGLIKAMLDDCLARSYRPQPFLSLAAAISAVAVAAGRRYATKTGLRPNLFFISVAPSGSGKDWPLDYVRQVLSAADLARYLGGETIASGAGLVTSLAAHPVRIFLLDELGLMLQAITGKKSAPYQAEIMSNLMKLYSRANSTFKGKEYGNQRENPRIDLETPHAAILGATTPSTLWAALEGGALIDGSVARFNVFLSDRHSVPRNKTMIVGDIPARILTGLQAISRGADGHDHGGNISAAMLATAPMVPYVVPYTPAAHTVMEAYLDKQEAWQEKISGERETIARPGEGEIVARIGEHCAKLAMVAAIGRNPGAPLIEKRDVAWAALLTDYCANTLLGQTSIHVADNEYEKKLHKAFDLVARFGPISESGLIQRGFKYPDRERNEILGTLVKGHILEEVRCSPGQQGGRPTVRYRVPVKAGADDGD